MFKNIREVFLLLFFYCYKLYRFTLKCGLFCLVFFDDLRVGFWKWVGLEKEVLDILMDNFYE